MLIALTVTFLILPTQPTAPVSAAGDRYVSAAVDPAGDLAVATGSGKTVVLRKQAEQVGFDQIIIADDRASVGWVVLQTNCCTSYPIPSRLVILSASRQRTFEGNGLPIWHWRFFDNGARFAFRQETVHGGLGIHYELRDVPSGRLLAEYSPEVGPDNQPLPNQTVPSWVAELDGMY